MPSGKNSRRVFVVTGASSGIGSQIARTLSEFGPVALIARRRDRLEALAAELANAATAHQADLTEHQQVAHVAQEIHEQYGQIDVLVNCAGARPDKILSTLDFERIVELWNHQLAVNLSSAAYLSYALAPFIRRGRGRIINISSLGGRTGGREPGGAGYAAAKAGMHGLTLGLSRELAPEGITVNTVAPGFIADTEFTGSWGPGVTRALVSELPVGRAGTTADIAEMVAFLASERSGFVSGALIDVNGGIP